MPDTAHTALYISGASALVTAANATVAAATFRRHRWKLTIGAEEAASHQNGQDRDVLHCYVKSRFVNHSQTTVEIESVNLVAYYRGFMDHIEWFQQDTEALKLEQFSGSVHNLVLSTRRNEDDLRYVKVAVTLTNGRKIRSKRIKPSKRTSCLEDIEYPEVQN
ncbi:hypothetical protein ACFU9B_43935 [Streptomyces sp. NPDC057592]|uniref:hypothetical protein n=1 Tax=unclassified Streptomyces TaxID=2593676 RepID=UPI0036C192EF